MRIVTAASRAQTFGRWWTMRADGRAEQPDVERVPLTTIDKLLAASTAVPALGIVVGPFLAPSWQLGVAALFMALLPWCAARALRRRRSARSLMGDGVPQPEAGRAASRLHLQEAGYALLAVALIFAAAGVLATLD